MSEFLNVMINVSYKFSVYVIGSILSSVIRDRNIYQLFLCLNQCSK